MPFHTFSKAAIVQGFPVSELAPVRYYTEELRNGAFAIGGPTDHVQKVTGRAPEDFESIARRYSQNPALIHPKLKVGSKLAATGFLVRMLATRVPDFAAWERERGHPLLTGPVLSQDSPEWRVTAERQQLNLLPTGQSQLQEIELIA